MSTALVPYRKGGLTGWGKTRAGLTSWWSRLTRAMTAAQWNSTGWSIVRGTQPSLFQQSGAEVRRLGWERHPVVNACARVVVELMASVPLETYRRDAKGEAVKIPKHPALDLLLSPRPDLSGARLIGRTGMALFLYGNAFWVLGRRGTRGQPKSIRVVPPEDILFVWLSEDDDSIVAYDWRDLQGRTHSREPAENVIHFRDLDATDGLFGYPRLASALLSIAADSEASQYVRQVVTNSGTPQLIIHAADGTSEVDLRAGEAAWKEKYAVRGNRGMTAFMSGLKAVEQIGFNLQQLEFPDLRKVTREDICAAANVDPRMISVASASSDGGLSGEQYREARFRLIQQTVYPLMRVMETELNHWFMPEYGETLIQFSEDYIAAITEDLSATSARVVAEVAAKIRTVEEAREAVALPADMDPTHTFPGGMEVGVAAENAAAMAAAALKTAENPPVPVITGSPNGAKKNGKPGKPKAATSPTRALLRADVSDTATAPLEREYERAALLQFAEEREEWVRTFAALALLYASMSEFAAADALRRVTAAYSPDSPFYRAWRARYDELIGRTVQRGGEQIADESGLDFSAANPKVRGLTNRRTADLVRSVTETTRDGIRAAIVAAREQLLTIPQTAQLISDTTFGAITKSRAKLIAKTECLPPDAPIDAARVTALYRRWYDGSMVTVTTLAGHQITGTPNHPVLTSAGWRGLGELTKGDHLVCNTSDIDCLRASTDVDIKDCPSTVAEIFDAAAAVLVAERNIGRKPDFHGDGREGDIDVLRSDSVLLVRDFAPLDERSVERILAPADARRLVFAANRTSFRRDLAVDSPSGYGVGTPSNTGVVQNSLDEFPTDAELLGQRLRRCARLVRSDDGLSWHISPEPRAAMALPVVVGVALANVAGDTSVVDCRHDPFGASVFNGRDLCGAEALTIQLDDVASVSVRPYSGHVYNLTTVDGYFLSDGIYTSNTIGALNSGEYAAAVQSGVMRSKTWLTQGDHRVRDSHAAIDGKTVDIGASFPNGLRYPHDPLGPAAEVCGCRCTCTFSDLEAGAR